MGYSFVLEGQANHEATESTESFDTNGVGCALLRRAMTAVGILDTAAARPDFPSWEIPGVSRRRMVAAQIAASESRSLDTILSESEQKIWDGIEVQEQQVLSARSSLPDHVPAFKFESNDNWHVLPEECSSIALALRSAVEGSKAGADPLVGFGAQKDQFESDDFDFILSFAEFCDLASSSGGFRVH